MLYDEYYLNVTFHNALHPQLVMTLVIFLQQPGLLVGLKCGDLSLVDLRCSDQVDIVTAKEDKYCIGFIRKQRDENYMTVSNLGGSVSLLNIRHNTVPSRCHRRVLTLLYPGGASLPSG